MADENPLSLLRLDLDPARLAAVAHRQHMPPVQSDLGYPLHALLSDLFGDNAAQPFRLFAETTRAPHLLAYTRSQEAELREHATRYADPSFHAACNWSTFALKALPPTWQLGLRLGFEVRACPVVRLAHEVTVEHHGHPRTYRRGSEVDAWQHRCWLAPEPEEVTREQAYREWLLERLEGTARLLQAGLHSFRRVRLARKGQRGEDRRSWKTLERPDALLTGDLEILDGPAFTELLARGVGRHAAFGFGMLLLRPPRGMG